MKLPIKLLVFSSIAALLGGCASFDTREPGKPAVGTAPAPGGGYYKDDGPGANPPANLADIPDAVPRAEPLHRGASRPYTVMGRDYVPMTEARGFSQQGLASWYGRRYHGRPTSSGEIYDMYAMTAAHPTLPIPSYVRVTNPDNGRSVVVRVNDRGPFHPDRVIDLSYTAAWKLDLLKGVGQVRVESIDPAAPPAATATAEAPPGRIVASPLVPLPTVAAPAPGTYLQMGAFISAESAAELGRRLRQRLGDLMPAIREVQAGDLIKVQVGPFDTLARADQAAQDLERETGIRPYRVTR